MILLGVRLLFAYNKNSAEEINAILHPEKMNFALVFQNIYRPSTTMFRVLSRSRWAKFIEDKIRAI